MISQGILPFKIEHMEEQITGRSGGRVISFLFCPCCWLPDAWRL